MKLSDKALRLIGLTVLVSMDRKKIQDDSKRPRNGSQAGGYGRPRLTLEARLKATQAVIIPFRNKNSES
jgi:hypothetical protein